MSSHRWLNFWSSLCGKSENTHTHSRTFCRQWLNSAPLVLRTIPVLQSHVALRGSDSSLLLLNYHHVPDTEISFWGSYHPPTPSGPTRSDSCCGTRRLLRPDNTKDSSVDRLWSPSRPKPRVSVDPKSVHYQEFDRCGVHVLGSGSCLVQEGQ